MAEAVASAGTPAAPAAPDAASAAAPAGSPPAAQSSAPDPSKPSAPEGTAKPDAPDGTATAAKEAADKAAADAAAGKKPDAPAPVVPEKYDLKVPDGFVIDPEIDTDFQSLAKELKLNPEQAQKVGDLGVKMQTRQKEALDKAQAEWAEASKTDKEFGGEKLSENLGAANKALDAFATPEFKKILKESKLGNHPEMIRFLVRTGKAMSDDNVVRGRQTGDPSDKSLEKRLYPNNP